MTKDKSVFKPPPDGWFTFGTHLNDIEFKLEFSEEKDDGGDPLWERPVPYKTLEFSEDE